METYFAAMNEADETVSREKLYRDLKTLVHDMEVLLKETAGEWGDKASHVRSQCSATLSRAKETCDQVERQLVAGAKAADHCVRHHPYQTMVICFGFGLLAGVLVARQWDTPDSAPDD